MFKKSNKSSKVMDTSSNLTPVNETILDETTLNDSSLSVTNSDETFKPKINRFCLPTDFAESILCWNLNTYDVVTPSYPVLLNHTIGVLWYLCEENDNINELSKSDITWALRFIEQINSGRMSDTRDLKTLILFLRNVLTAKYASQDESKVNELESTFVENNISQLPFSHSLHEYDNSFDVQQMLTDEDNRNAYIPTVERDQCDDKELIRRLRELQNVQPEDRKIETIDQLISLLDQTNN